MTGESSSTRIAEFAARADADGRPAIVLYFSDHAKGLVLNKTNANTLQEIYGADTDSWQGQTIRLVIEAADAGTASLVEAGIDDVRITQQ